MNPPSVPAVTSPSPTPTHSSGASGPRSPQLLKPHIISPYNSDEILNPASTAPPRPPRHNRQRSESTSSFVMSAPQYYQHYHTQHPQPSSHGVPYENYLSSTPPSLRPSPRSTPSSGHIATGPYPSQPSSPVSFLLPPSALSPTSPTAATAREDALRSNHVAYQNVYTSSPRHHSHSQSIQHMAAMSSTSSIPSYRGPHMSPGTGGVNGFASTADDESGGSISSGSSSRGNISGHISSHPGMVTPSMPPLSLPEAFLEEQSDYAEYYGDAFETMSPQHHAVQQHQTYRALPIHAHQPVSAQQHDPEYPTLASLSRHLSQQSIQQSVHPSMQQQSAGPGSLPSPHLTPTISPLSSELLSMTLDDSVASRHSALARLNTEVIQSRPEGYYQGRPHVPVESFLMPTQEQYPPDSTILFGGTATHSEGLFRKDTKEYFLLTNTSLLRYKSMEKAAKVLGNQLVWSSSSGHQLLTPQQTNLITKDHRMLSLNSIVGVHTTQSSGSDVHIVIEYLTLISSQPATMQFTPVANQVDSWLKELRQGCNHHAPQAGLIAKGTRQRQWVLDKVNDDHITLPQSVPENDPTALTAGGMWRAYFKSQRIKGVPSQENNSNDSKVPLEGKVVVIAIGKSFIYILPHNLGNGSAKEELKDERIIQQYPLLTTKAICYRERDDTFAISFGTTLRQRKVVMTFASARAREIIIAIRARVESLRWLYPLGRKGIELSLSEMLSQPIPVPSKEYLADLGFEDLLRAECSAMNVDRKVYSNVRVEGFRITIGKTGGEGPEQRRDYTVDEMKVLFRALRFNTTFKEIVFHGISFSNLQRPRTLKDGTIRYGLRLDKEFYELVMGNPQLRILDLHNSCLETSTIGSIGRAIRDGHSAGLRLEHLDLFGNNASDGADVMTLAKGLVKHAGTLHFLDVGNCLITGDGINQIMHAFVANADVASHTLETFSVHSNAESKVNSFILDMFLKHSMQLRHLNLSNLASWSKSPILMSETLGNCGGFLSSLDLSGMALHSTTLDQILTWITSPSFDTMERIRVEGCGLDGNQFASILDAISQSRNSKVEILAGKNLLSDGNDLPESLVSVLANGDTVSSLGLRQTCWSEQALRQLLTALSQNWSLKRLDLSAVSLDSNRDPDVETCKMLGQMVSSSSSRLEELFLQGEETAELTSRMGKNLWRSFQGIGSSRYLTRLNVRRNRFRDEGALALAEALRVNQSLQWLDMDENDVTMDGFNAILSAFHQGGTEHVPTGSRFYNSTLCYFEPPVRDVDKQVIQHKEAMLETYKTEQETRFLLVNSAGKDSREWKERLAQIIRTRNISSEAIARLERAMKGISVATERNKAAMDAVYRDREQRRDRVQDQDRDRERDRDYRRESLLNQDH